METQERKSWGWYIKHKRHKAGGSTKALEQERWRGGEEDFEYKTGEAQGHTRYETNEARKHSSLKTPDAQKHVGHKASEA